MNAGEGTLFSLISIKEAAKSFNSWLFKSSWLCNQQLLYNHLSIKLDRCAVCLSIKLDGSIVCLSIKSDCLSIKHDDYIDGYIMWLSIKFDGSVLGYNFMAARKGTFSRQEDLFPSPSLMKVVEGWKRGLQVPIFIDGVGEGTFSHTFTHKCRRETLFPHLYLWMQDKGPCFHHLHY